MKGPAVGGLEDGILALYEEFFRGVFGYCVYRLYSKDLAEEATSEVFLRLVAKYPAIRRKSTMEIRNWLYGTASNVAAEYLREARRRKAVLEELARSRAGGRREGINGDGRLDWPVLYEAIGRLNRRQQEIIVLRYFEGLETAAIAAALDMKHVTVRVMLSRAVKRLRRDLEIPFGQDE